MVGMCCVGLFWFVCVGLGGRVWFLCVYMRVCGLGWGGFGWSRFGFSLVRRFIAFV